MKKFLTSAIMAICAMSAPAMAQDWPTKGIKIIVPFNSGTGSDADSRFYSNLLSKELNVPVVVENKPGGNSLISVQAVKSAPADGYTMLAAGNSPMSVNPAINANLAYDPFKDFKPIAGLSKSHAIFLVSGKSKYKHMSEIIQEYQGSDKDIALANYSPGYQLIASWFGDATKVKVNHINYKGGSQITTDLIGGQLELAIAEPTSFIDLHQSGQVRILASTGDKRNPKLPDVPTMKELGYKEFESSVWSSLFVRSETPDDITQKLIAAVKKVMNSKEAQEYRTQRTVEHLDAYGDDLRKFQMNEYTRFKDIAIRAGLRTGN